MKIKTVSELSGFPIGRSDKNGVPISCGDRVIVTERTPAYLQTTTQDGWGRDVPLCRHDQQLVAEKVEVFRGVVGYSERFCAFRVHFSDRWPDEDFVYMLSEIEIDAKAAFAATTIAGILE